MTTNKAENVTRTITENLHEQPAITTSHGRDGIR